MVQCVAMRYTHDMSTNVTALPGHGERANTPQQIVADNLAAELARKRLTGREAARALGLGHMYVARRVAGEVELGVSDLFAFAGLLGIDVSVLLDGVEPTNVPPTD